VETADDGETALARLREREFGLVLMDCQMPRLDGLETARRLRAFEGGRRRVPIVAISANSTAEDRQACLDAGMDDFVSKPATLETLAEAVDRWDRPFDAAALDAFAAVAGEGPQDLPRLLGDFLAGARGYVDAARAARAAGDPMACSRSAHALKGAAAAVGARGLRELALRVERCAKGEESGDLDALLRQLAAELERAAASAPRGTAA
jgi:two-component system, sensor histidine kinase and response regulator